jgi:hypothetical protein
MEILDTLLSKVLVKMSLGRLLLHVVLRLERLHGHACLPALGAWACGHPSWLSSLPP